MWKATPRTFWASIKRYLQPKAADNPAGRVSPMPSRVSGISKPLEDRGMSAQIALRSGEQQLYALPTARLTVIGLPDQIQVADRKRVTDSLVREVTSSVSREEFASGEKIGVGSGRIRIGSNEYTIEYRLEATRALRIASLHKMFLDELRRNTQIGKVDSELAAHAAKHLQEVTEEKMSHVVDLTNSSYGDSDVVAHPSVVERVVTNDATELVVEYWNSARERTGYDKSS